MMLFSIDICVTNILKSFTSKLQNQLFLLSYFLDYLTCKKADCYVDKNVRSGSILLSCGE